MDSASPALELCLPCRALSALAEELLAQGDVWRGQHTVGASWGKETSCHPQGEGSSGGKERPWRGYGECAERLWLELRGAGAVPEGDGTQQRVLMAVGGNSHTQSLDCRQDLTGGKRP